MISVISPSYCCCFDYCNCINNINHVFCFDRHYSWTGKLQFQVSHLLRNLALLIAMPFVRPGDGSPTSRRTIQKEWLNPGQRWPRSNSSNWPFMLPQAFAPWSLCCATSRQPESHLESYTPVQDRANSYVPVRTGTYRYIPVHASTGFLEMYVLVRTGIYN
jgi:hypothetical protein